MSRLEDIEKQINELTLEKNKIVEENRNAENEKIKLERDTAYNEIIDAYNKYLEIDEERTNARNTYLELKAKYMKKYGSFSMALHNGIPNNQPEFWLDWIAKNI